MMNPTHKRIPIPVLAWRCTGQPEDLPKWALEGGISPEDICREVDGEVHRAVPIGVWLVKEHEGHIGTFSDEWFKRCFEGAF